jgi:hypothetical protein
MVNNCLGKTFGHLKVIAVRKDSRKERRNCLCLCECGNIFWRAKGHVMNSKIGSCGCIKYSTHKMTNTRPYRIWGKMKGRCLNKRNPQYKDYGGRGIDICKEWYKFENFWNDMKEKYKEDLQIDRINNDKGYYKENCRWTTAKVNSNNRRQRKDAVLIKYNNKKYSIKKLSAKFHMGKTVIESRFRRGYSEEDIIKTPFGAVRLSLQNK